MGLKAHSPVQIMDVVEGGRLSKAHSGLPDILAAVQRLHVLNRVLEMTESYDVYLSVTAS